MKNIPDVSQAEEKEAATVHNRSAESSPTASRFPDAKLRQPRQASSSHNTSTSNTPHHANHHNGQSSDSGSDYEPPNKRNKHPHNGRGNARQYLNRHVEKIPENIRVPSAVALCNPGGVITIDNAPPPLAYDLPAATLRTSHLPNFYQETLKEDVEEIEEIEKREVPPIYSSVIQPNPEYSHSAGFYKQSESDKSFTNAGFKDTIGTYSEKRPTVETIVPRLHIDLSKSFQNSNTSTKTPTTPMFHLDLSAMPLTPQSERNNLPFTPTLIRHPHTPIFKDSGIFKSTLHRSESLNQFAAAKKGPPPALQTLKRTTSLYDTSHLPNMRHSMSVVEDQVEDLSIPKSKPVPMFHLDLSNYNFDASNSTGPTNLTTKNVSSLPKNLSKNVADLPSGKNLTGTPRRRKGQSTNEPPPLLPITPIAKQPPSTLTSSSLRKAPPLEIDEDYDT